MSEDLTLTLFLMVNRR